MSEAIVPEDNHAHDPLHPDDQTDAEQELVRKAILAHVDGATEALRLAGLLARKVRDWGPIGRTVVAGWYESLADCVATCRTLAEL